MSNNIPQQNLIAYVQSLLDEALKSYQDGFPKDGYEYVEDVYEYLKIFIEGYKNIK